MRLNEELEPNSQKDKALRFAFNFISFVAYTVLASFIWSAHLFTRHMRFKAQNNQLARTNGNTSNTGTGRRNCPWLRLHVVEDHLQQKACAKKERQIVNQCARDCVDIL